MIEWTKIADGWRLELGRADGPGPSLPRLEIHRGRESWVVCVLGPGSGRARTGTAWSDEEARRAAVIEARAFLGGEHQPALAELLSRREPAPPAGDLDRAVGALAL